MNTLFDKAVCVVLAVNPRYPDEDGILNGKEDTHKRMPFLDHKGCWRPSIDLATGKILGWPIGTTARVHYKICDDGSYYLRDMQGNTVGKIEDDYVPDMIPGEYGDYIIMDIGVDGEIKQWAGVQNYRGFKVY